MTAALGIADLGIPEVVSSHLPAEHAVRVAAAVNGAADPAQGNPLPLLWHWAFFTPAPPNAALGRDGHPRLPDHGPPADLPRRMFAGGRIRRRGPLTVGVPAERHARIVGAEEKTGRSGRLLVVTVGYEIHQRGQVVIEEEQDLIYREASAQISLPGGTHEPAVAPGGWREDVLLDRVALFRFSAVTFNAHRIHYDAEYAQQVEGYPRLIVHGPLVALLLAQSAQTHLPADIAAFDFRATAPLFEGMPFSLVGELEDGEARLTAVRNDGDVAMRATAAC